MKIKDLDFRIWHNTLNLFVSFPCLVNEKDYFLIPRYDEDSEFELWTGLYDKNGLKIFEGDIIEWDKCYPFSDKVGVIVWSNGTGLEAKNYKRNTNKATGFIGLKGKNNHCKVIGNIHENKELLGQGKEV